MSGTDQDPFEAINRSGPPKHCLDNGPKPVLRVIGAVCGGFVFCFVAILMSLPLLAKIGLPAANVFWGMALILGTIGGAVFPRVGHFLAYTFLIFMNVMLSMTIGRNPWEQLLLFAIFVFVEFVFLMVHWVSRKDARMNEN